MKTLLSIALMFVSLFGYSQTDKLIKLNSELDKVNVQLDNAFSIYASDKNINKIDNLNSEITKLSDGQFQTNEANASRKRSLVNQYNTYRYEYSKYLGTPEEQAELKSKMDSLAILIKTYAPTPNQYSTQIHKIQYSIDSLRDDSNQRFENYNNLKTKRIHLMNQIDSEMTELRTKNYNQKVEELSKVYGKDKATKLILKSPFIGLTLEEFYKFEYSGTLIHDKNKVKIYKDKEYDIYTEKLKDRYLIFTNGKLTSITNKISINI